jgi:cell division protein FtsI (penicillin-binding protein 3)
MPRDFFVERRTAPRHGSAVMQAATEIANLTKPDPATIFFVADQESDLELCAGLQVRRPRHQAGHREAQVPGTIFRAASQRTYPNGAVASNLTGYMSTDGPGGGLELGDDKAASGAPAEAPPTNRVRMGADPRSEVINTASKPGGTLGSPSTVICGGSPSRRSRAGHRDRLAATAIVLRIRTSTLMAVADWPPVDPTTWMVPDLANYGSHAFTAQYSPAPYSRRCRRVSSDTGIGSPAMQADLCRPTG